MREQKGIDPVKGMTANIEGITAEVYTVNGSLLQVSSVGRIFKEFREGASTFLLNITIESGQCIAYNRRRARSGKWALELRESDHTDDNRISFAQKIVVTREPNQKAHANYPANCIRLLYIPHDKGQEMKILVFSLFCQDNALFLGQQVIWQGDIYEKNKGFIFQPSINDDLVETFLCSEIRRQRLWEDKAFIRSENDIPHPWKPSKLRKGEMRVMYFNLANGTGVGVLENGNQVKIHLSNIVSDYHGLRFLYPGQIVGISGTADIAGAEKGQLKRQALRVDHRYRRTNESQISDLPVHLRKLIEEKEG
jgi:hypothetical protein